MSHSQPHLTCKMTFKPIIFHSSIKVAGRRNFCNVIKSILYECKRVVKYPRDFQGKSEGCPGALEYGRKST